MQPTCQAPLTRFNRPCRRFYSRKQKMAKNVRRVRVSVSARASCEMSIEMLRVPNDLCANLSLVARRPRFRPFAEEAGGESEARALGCGII